MTNNKPRIDVMTLGCKVNQYDSDAMLAIFAEGGLEVTEGAEQADVYILNTCAVTAEAERKSRQAVGKILKINPEAEIYVCGCASQNNFSQFARDGVKFISGTRGKLELARELVKKYGKLEDDGYFDKIITPDFGTSGTYEEYRGALSMRTRHFVKVQDGCNNFCSYCIVPYLRGRSRSRSMSGVLAEINDAAITAKEVVITGINLSAYGKDIGTSLTNLLTALQNSDMRIRLGSLEVGVIDRDFLEAAKGLKKFCPHFHLSLQSGDDGVLKNMNRHYTTAEFLEKVRLIRSVFPDAAITTDVIVGYPTETEEAFLRSMEFCREVAFSDMHVFPYSSRKGTAAGKLPVLPSAEVTDRQKRMSALKVELSSAYLLAQLGKPAEVLFETKEDGMWCGHTPNYVKVYSTYGAHNTIAEVVPTALCRDGVRV